MMTQKLSDEETSELIRIANAGVKDWRIHWFILGLPIPHHYRLEEQLDAITKLGESQNPRALEYLSRLIFEVRTTEGYYVDEPESYTGGHWTSGETYVGFPNARGELKRVLSSDKAKSCHRMLINAYKRISGKKTRFSFSLKPDIGVEGTFMESLRGGGFHYSRVRDFRNISRWDFEGSYSYFEIWISDKDELQQLAIAVRQRGLRFRSSTRSQVSSQSPENLFRKDYKIEDTFYDLFFPRIDETSESFPDWYTGENPGIKLQ